MSDIRLPGKGLLKYATDFVKSTAEDLLNYAGMDFDDFVDEPSGNVSVVPEKPVWSLFKFINKPQLVGLEDIQLDNRVYFTIPLGILAASGKYHYLVFPAGGYEDEVKEVSCVYNIVTASQAEECN